MAAAIGGGFGFAGSGYGAAGFGTVAAGGFALELGSHGWLNYGGVVCGDSVVGSVWLEGGCLFSVGCGGNIYLVDL